MKEEISKIKEKALEEILNTQELKLLNDVKIKYLGKKGELTRNLEKIKIEINELWRSL